MVNSIPQRRKRFRLLNRRQATGGRHVKMWPYPNEEGPEAFCDARLDHYSTDEETGRPSKTFLPIHEADDGWHLAKILENASADPWLRLDRTRDLYHVCTAYFVRPEAAERLIHEQIEELQS